MSEWQGLKGRQVHDASAGLRHGVCGSSNNPRLRRCPVRLELIPEYVQQPPEWLACLHLLSDRDGNVQETATSGVQPPGAAKLRGERSSCWSTPGKELGPPQGPADSSGRVRRKVILTALWVADLESDGGDSMRGRPTA